MSKPFYDPLRDIIRKELKTLVSQTSESKIAYKDVFKHYPEVTDLAGIGDGEYYREAVLIKFHRHIKPAPNTAYLLGDISGTSADAVPYRALPSVFKALLSEIKAGESSHDMEEFIHTSESVLKKVDDGYAQYGADHSQRPALGVILLRKMIRQINGGK